MVAMLFPLTSLISTLPDWSIDGIMSHVKSFGLKPRVCISFYAQLQLHNVLFTIDSCHQIHVQFWLCLLMIFVYNNRKCYTDVMKSLLMSKCNFLSLFSVHICSDEKYYVIRIKISVKREELSWNYKLHRLIIGRNIW